MLPYTQRRFDQTYTPIDHTSGTVILAADYHYQATTYGAYDRAPNLPQSDKTKQAWEQLPWQAELAGNDRQIQNFLRIHFPTWKGKLEPSKVWKMEDVERAGKAAAEKPRPVQEQVSKILEMRKPVNEATYYRTKTASEVYDQMDLVLDYTLFAGDSDVDVADYGLSNIQGIDGPEVATVWLIVSNQDTEEDSINRTKVFLRKKNILFHDVKSEETGVENQWYVEAQYVDPITEAQYAYQKLTADEVVNRYIDFIQAHHPNVTFGDIIVVEYNFSDAGDALYASLDLWVLNSSIQEAENKVKSFAKHFDLPYTEITIPLDSNSVSLPNNIPSTHKKDVQHDKVYASMWYKSENKLEVFEARYADASDDREMFFVVDETGDLKNPTNVVGPFGTKNDASRYIKYMKKVYSEWVTFNFTVVERTSPDKYEELAKEQQDWMTADLTEAQYQPGKRNKEQAYTFEMTEHFYNDKDVQHALSKIGPTEVSWSRGMGVQSNTRIGYVDAYTTLSQAEEVHTILQKIFFLKADQEVDYPLRAYGGYQSY